MRVFIIVVLANLVGASALLAQPDPKVVNAYESGVETEKQFRIVSDFVKSSDEDSRWREVEWIPDLWKGVEVASEKQKPIFVWAMNGDPLGCV